MTDARINTATTTGRINAKALELLDANPEGLQWSELNALIKASDKTLHPKTINGCVWKLVEKFPDRVCKPAKGQFRLVKYAASPCTSTANKTAPTAVNVNDFLTSLSDNRRSEAEQLMQIMTKVSGDKPVMWGPSIIGFGQAHYKYETGREGDVAKLGFSPRKAAITVYFMEGFADYHDELQRLGKHKTSVSCLYINKLTDIDMVVLEGMLKKSYASNVGTDSTVQTVDGYVASVPRAGRPLFDELRNLIRAELPHAVEALSYGIIGYKIDNRRARVFVSGWKDHVAMYPIPRSPELQEQLAPYIKGKGTLWFPLDKPLPSHLIKRAIRELTE